MPLIFSENFILKITSLLNKAKYMIESVPFFFNPFYHLELYRSNINNSTIKSITWQLCAMSTSTEDIELIMALYFRNSEFQNKVEVKYNDRSLYYIHVLHV